MLEIHDALEAFEKVEPRKAQVVKLKYFVGFGIHETARALGLSSSTAERYWLYSKAWLFDYLERAKSDRERPGDSQGID